MSDYGSPIPVRHLTDRVSSYIHAYTLYSAVRPFGTTIMFGTYTDVDGPELYCVENSGLYYRYWGAAVSVFKVKLIRNSNFLGFFLRLAKLSNRPKQRLKNWR